MSNNIVNKFIMLIVLGTVMVTIVLAQSRQSPAQCRDLCSRVFCASGPDRRVCQRIRGATFLPYNPDKCQCCQQCVRYRYEGQSCRDDFSPSNRVRVVCAEGLFCDQGIRCVANRRTDRRSSIRGY